jgi:hypothetical protein
MSGDVDPSEPASEQFDTAVGMVFGVGHEDIAEMANSLEQAEAAPTDELTKRALADYVAALKRLEDAVEDARKDVFEPALDERASPGERVGNLNHATGSNRYVADEDGAIEALRAHDVDPMDVASLKASDAADLLELVGEDPDEYVEESEYDYWRRSG